MGDSIELFRRERAGRRERRADRRLEFCQRGIDNGEPIGAIQTLRREKMYAKITGKSFKDIDPMWKEAAEAERADKKIAYMEIERRPTDDLPEWLLSGIEKLQEEYPDDLFETLSGNPYQRIFCHECPLNQFSFGAKAINLKKHLDGPTHRENVAARLIKESTEPRAIKHPLLLELPGWFRRVLRDVHEQYPDDKILPKYDDENPSGGFPVVECLEFTNDKDGRPVMVVNNEAIGEDYIIRRNNEKVALLRHLFRKALSNAQFTIYSVLYISEEENCNIYFMS